MKAPTYQAADGAWVFPGAVATTTDAVKITQAVAIAIVMGWSGPSQSGEMRD